MTESGGTSSFYHGDGSGSVTALINANQLLVGKYLYDPFGNTLAVSGPKALANPYRFSSKPIHELSGHYDFLYRWYAPELQRWLNCDPIHEDGGLNLYAYVSNDPINAFDPLGLKRKLDWHHIFVQQFELYFLDADIDIHDKSNGLMLPRKWHRDLHALGYNDHWEDFFVRGKAKKTPDQVRAFARELARNPLFKEYFEFGTVPKQNFRRWSGPASKVLIGFGAITALATASASAENIACNLKNFVNDKKAGKDDWAYVDALSVRHELNQHGFFAGDIAMRGMYKGSD